MTQDQFEAVMAKLDAVKEKLNAIAKAVAPREGNMGLVGTGEPPAVTVPFPHEIVANPAKYDGTPYDPIKRDFRMENTVVISRFESMSKSGEFAGGTLQDWARTDFEGCWRFLQSQYPGLDVNRLSVSQRAFLGL